MPPETPGKHRDLRGHADAHRYCGKSLRGTALVGVDARQHARSASALVESKVYRLVAEPVNPNV